MSGGGTCPVCREPMPAPKSGRPPIFCSSVCRKRADRRRSQAAQILEFVDLLVRNAAKDEAGATPEQLARRRVSRQHRIGLLRDDAAALLEGIGPGTAS
jgi:predicted nucleic acid-binding Zn ribbon protein